MGIEGGIGGESDLQAERRIDWVLKSRHQSPLGDQLKGAKSGHKNIYYIEYWFGLDWIGFGGSKED